MRGEWSSRGAGPHEASRLGKASRKLDFWIRLADRFVSSPKPRGCMLDTLSNVLRKREDVGSWKGWRRMPCSYWWMICKPSSVRRLGSVGISLGPAGRLVNVWACCRIRSAQGLISGAAKAGASLAWVWEEAAQVRQLKSHVLHILDGVVISHAC